MTLRFTVPLTARVDPRILNDPHNFDPACLRQLTFVTEQGAELYYLPASIADIRELWIERDDGVHVLIARINEDFPADRVEGFPTYFKYIARASSPWLLLYPVPDRVYTIGALAVSRDPDMPGGRPLNEIMREQAQHVAQKSERARQLLEEWLSPGQLKQYRKHGAFYVRGSLGGHYIVEARDNFGVRQFDVTGKFICSLCFVPAQPFIMGDVLLAQKILLETDERRAQHIANRSHTHPTSGIPYAKLLPQMSRGDEPMQQRRFAGRAALDDPDLHPRHRLRLDRAP